MSPHLQERATPAAAQPLQPLPLGEEHQQQLEREDSDSDSSGEESDSDSSGEESGATLSYRVCVLCCGGGCGLRGAPAVCCVWLVLCVMSSVIEASIKFSTPKCSAVSLFKNSIVCIFVLLCNSVCVAVELHSVCEL